MAQPIKDIGKPEIGGIYFIRHDGALLDITPQCALIIISESILKPWCTIKLTINDSINILGSLPMIGEEYIYIEFKTKEESFNMIKKVFKVTSIDSKKKIQPRQEVYEVFGVSIESFMNRNTSVVRAYAGATPSDIAQNVWSNHLEAKEGPLGPVVKPFYVWGTTGLTTIYSPRLSPLSFIQLLARKSRSIQTEPETGEQSIWADFMFFENLDGFYFYPKSALRNGYGGLGDSFFLALGNQPGAENVYADQFLEKKAKVEKSLKKFAASVNSGGFTDIASQLGTSLGAVTGQLGDALSSAVGPMTTALQQGADTLSGVMNSIMNGVILNGAGKPRHDELNKDRRFDSSTLIKSIQFKSQGNLQGMNARGLFSNATEIVDPIRKNVRRHDWNYKDQFNEIGHTGLNQKPIISKNNGYVKLKVNQLTNTVIGYNTNGVYREEDYISQSVGVDPWLDPYLHFADQDNSFLPHRVASEACDENYTIAVVVPGHSMTRAGHIVDIFLPMSADDKDGHDKYDPQITNSMGAQFLVETANHIIDPVNETYETHMTLTKDSYANEVDSQTETESLYPDEAI